VSIITPAEGVQAAANGVIIFTDESPLNPNGFYRIKVH
jgi:hypothetical protein